MSMGEPQIGEPPVVFLVAGEVSGDALGAGLMRALTKRLGAVRFSGVGGRQMEALGLRSIFPIEKIQLHGLSEVLIRLPDLWRRINATADEIARLRPSVLVLVDAPAFGLRVAKRVRRRAPEIPVVDYVSPSVWAWAPWRARWMKPYVDQLMAILPFEPEVHRALGGPPTTYVGHPLIERLTELRPGQDERTELGPGAPPVLLILPGSRRSEVERLMQPFGETAALVAEKVPGVEIVLPAVPALADEIKSRASRWPAPPAIVVGEEAKLGAFRRAHAALAASGTVTLELALAGVPMVVAYRVDLFLRALKPFLAAKSIVLANLISGENAIPEFLDRDVVAGKLTNALLPLLSDTPERRRQIEALAKVRERMKLEGESPSERAAAIVASTMRRPAPPGFR
jgi:lipid-A-disaccharide synthase